LPLERGEALSPYGAWPGYKMAHSIPFEQLTGTLDVYIAPVGSTVPGVTETPAAPWVYLGETDGEQSLQHAGALTYFRDNEHQGPRKAVRPEEDVIVSFTLVALTLEKYARVLHDVANVETDTAPNLEMKTMPLQRGFVPTEYALLFRGEALSPYGAWPGMYVIPRGVFDAEPQPTFAKDGRASIECEFHALVDATQDEARRQPGWLVVQAGGETQEEEDEEEEDSCLLEIGGWPTPAIVATYDAFSEDLIAPDTQRLLYGVAADATHIYLVYADLPYSNYIEIPKVLKIPYRDGGLFEGPLSGATWGLVESSFVGMRNEPYDCVVDSNHVYVGTERGLYILDKVTLEQIGACEFVDEPWLGAPFLQHVILSADGRYIYGGGSGFGMAVFDVGDPESPTCIYYNPFNDCEYLVYDGVRYLFVVDDFWSFAVFDMSTPNPTQVFFSDEIFGGTQYHCGNAYSRHRNLVALGQVVSGEMPTQAWVELFDVSDPSDVQVYDSIPLGPLGFGYEQIFDVGLAGYYVLALSIDSLGHHLFFNRLGNTGWDAVEMVIPGEFRNTYGHEHLIVVDSRYVIVSGPQGYVFVIDACADGNGGGE